MGDKANLLLYTETKEGERARMKGTKFSTLGRLHLGRVNQRGDRGPVQSVKFMLQQRREKTWYQSIASGPGNHGLVLRKMPYWGRRAPGGTPVVNRTEASRGF